MPVTWLRCCALLGVLLSLAAALLAGCGDDTTKLRVGNNDWPGYQTLTLALQQGLLDPRFISHLDFPSSEETMRAFRNGALDAAALTLDEALLVAQSGKEPRIVMVFDISNGADALLAKPGIDNLADLKGQRIGVETGAVGYYLLTRLLDFAHLQPQDLTIVDLPVDQQEQAYLEGRVDALITLEPVRGRLLKAGARELFSSRQIPNEIVDVLVVRQDALKTHARALQKLIEAHFMAVEQIRRNPDAAAQSLAKTSGVPAQDMLAAWRGMQLPDRSLNRQLLTQRDGGVLATLGKLQAVMLERQLLPGPVDLAPLVDARFAGEAGR